MVVKWWLPPLIPNGIGRGEKQENNRSIFRFASGGRTQLI